MQFHTAPPARHVLELAPKHVRQQRVSITKAARKRTIAQSIQTLATGSFAALRSRYNQRCIVKISYTKNTKRRSWAAHGAYLQREHAQNKHEKGYGFNQTSDSVDLKRTLLEWQNNKDEYLFRFIISPENGHKLDLKEHAKALMNQLENDLKTKLQWAAIDHYNTDHPHLHILVRAKDQRGHTLTIDRDYLSHGIRHRSQELVTLKLGLRLNHDRVQARKKQIEYEYLTELDRSLRHKAINSIVNFSQPALGGSTIRELRLLEIERLKFLETLGLAEKIGKKMWQLSDNLEPTLREMQLSNDIIKSRARHNVQTLTYDLPAPTQLQEHQPLTGKVVGMGLENELQDKRYLLLEGTDGKVHYIQATHSMIKARDNFEFGNGHVITLEKKKFVNRQSEPIEYIQVQSHRTLDHMQKIPASRLDHDVIEFVKTHHIEPKHHFPVHSFAHEYSAAMTKRFHQLIQEKVIVHQQDRYHLAHDWQKRLSHATSKQHQTLCWNRRHHFEGCRGSNKPYH
ncbi:MAG: conjugal transfer protein TraI [Gammaproteobacteria bacterium]|jgi:type IV secretory pathway VirD2 relaxase|nr:conjugal transfer protein TraI [Gammaproteobacteria bacterium]